MAVFSVTDLANFRRCRRKWDWSSNARQNLTSVGAGPEPLELGGLVHRVLADWIMNWYSEDEVISYKAKNVPNTTIKVDENEDRTFTYLGYLFLQHFTLRQAEIIAAFNEKNKRGLPPPYLDSLNNVLELGISMMDNYQRFHQSPLPRHMSFASPEQEVLIPVPGTEHRCKPCFEAAYANNMVTVLYADHITLENNLRFPANPNCTECQGTGKVFHYLSATLDGLLQDQKDYLLVLEHKTYENRPKLIDLSMNDQFTGYCWVVRELKIGKVAGIAYDGMWKRPKPPKYMQSEKRAGTMDDLFIRKVISKGNDELDQWGSNLTKTILDMANSPAIYPNVPWSGCNDCSFINPCLMTMKGEDPSNLIKLEYTQREVIRGGR